MICININYRLLYNNNNLNNKFLKIEVLSIQYKYSYEKWFDNEQHDDP